MLAQVDSGEGSELDQIQQLIERGQKIEALGRVRQALTRFPEEPNLYNFLGVLEAEASHYAAAETSFRRAIQLGPRITSAYVNLGRLYQENSGKEPQALSKAVEIYIELLSHHPGHAEARYQCARLVCLQGKFEDSLNHLSRLPAADQKFPHVLIIGLTAQAALGRRALARETASRLLSNPSLAEADILSFLPLLSKHGQNSTVVSLLEQLERRSNLSWEGLRELALLYEGNAQLVEARRTLEEAVQRSEPSVGLLLDLARIAHRQKDPQGVLGYLAHARDLRPEDPQIHFLFGAVCAELDLSADAYESFKKAAQLDGENADYNLAAGAVALQHKGASESLAYLTMYRSQRPKDPRGHLALGAAYYQSGRLEESQQELRIAARSAETASAAYYYLGRLALQMDDLQLATRELSLALRANPKHLDAAAELALVQIRTGNYKLAAETLMTILGKDPDHYKANMHLLNLYQRTKDPRSQDQEQRFEDIKRRRSDREQSLLRRVEFIN
jgi:tetratricopeptide (TPR) repeat protein